MKKTKRLITIVVLCLAVAVLCSMAALAVEARWAVDCLVCNRGTIIDYNGIETSTTEADLCEHYRYGYDVYQLQRSVSYEYCNYCGYKSTTTYGEWDWVLISCQGYN